MAEPKIPDFFDMSPESIRAIRAIQHEHREAKVLEAFLALVELRRRFGGFSKRVVVMVYVPQCESCYAAERHQLRTGDSTWRPPDICARTWREGLREFGATERDIRRTYREMNNASRDVPLVRCDTCNAEIRYGREDVYVFARPFEHQFPKLVGGEDRDAPQDPPNFVRELVYRAYGGKCAGCGVLMSRDKQTMEHIRPRRIGGPGTLENIQLACGPCNESKGGDEPGEVHVWLDFLLIAQAPEYEELRRLAEL